MLYRRAMWHVFGAVAAIALVVGIFAGVALGALPAWAMVPAFALYAVTMGVAAFTRAARCPDCGFGFTGINAWRLRRGHAQLRLNFCPHCGADFDAPPATPR